MKIKITDKAVFSSFYFISGIIMLVLLILSGGRMIHLGFIGSLSILASYGLSRRRRWALLLLVIVFFTGLTLSLSTIYAASIFFGFDFDAVLIYAVASLYLMMLIVSFLNALLNREKFD